MKRARAAGAGDDAASGTGRRAPKQHRAEPEPAASAAAPSDAAAPADMPGSMETEASAAAAAPPARRLFCWREAAQRLASSSPRAAAALSPCAAQLQALPPPLALPPQELLHALHDLMLADAPMEEALLPALRAFRPLMIALLASCAQAQTERAGSAGFDLRRHERLGATFSLLARAMPRPGHVLLLLDEYYRRAPSPFERLDRGAADGTADGAALLDIARTALRLLEAGYRGQINWAPLFALLRADADAVRWYATRGVALLLGLRAESLGQLYTVNRVSPVPPSCFTHEAEAVAAENAVACAVPTARSQCGVEADSLRQWVSGLTVVDDIILPTTMERGRSESASSARAQAASSFVSTGACQRNLRSVATALAVGKPVMLEGPPGVGKTALLNELARNCGHSDGMIRIHLDDQLDSKTLLGSYVCSDEPGQFKWQPGALTQAVRGGRWIVFEDIHCAPFELLAAIKPLLEDRVLFVPGRGERIQAASGFQLFATQTMHEGPGASSKSSRGGIFSNLFTHVPVDPLPEEDVRQILDSQFSSSIGCCVPVMLDTVRELRAQGIAAKLGRSEFSLRDLIKWGRRVQLLCRGEALPAERRVQDMPYAVRMKAVRESEDSFCAGWAKPAAKKRAVDAIRAIWQIDQRYLDTERPQITRTPLIFQIGRYELDVREQGRSLEHSITAFDGGSAERYTETSHSLSVLERVAACAKLGEPCLLIGETGTGKTSSVQHVAKAVNRKLVVINLNQQTDASDLLGGFKPLDIVQLARPVVEAFEKVFCKTFSKKSNGPFLKSIHKSLQAAEWKKLVRLIKSTLERVDAVDMSSAKRQKTAARWQEFRGDFARFEQQSTAQKSFAFSFVEGALVTAIRNGDWVLLDEINLAPAETLERLAGLLDGDAGSVCLTERGDTEAIPRHGQFRLFACMNPPTDAGKKELPPGLRSRFTEVLVPEMTNEEDLRQIVGECLHACPAAKVHDAKGPVSSIVKFYLEVRAAAERGDLLDGAEARPVYTLRTLMRSLYYTTEMVAEYGFNRSLYDGICMSFLTQLQGSYHPAFEKLVTKFLLPSGSKLEALRASQHRPADAAHAGQTFVSFEASLPKDKKKLSQKEVETREKQAKKEAKEGFWIERGESSLATPEWFIVVPSVRTNLLNLTRAVLSRHPTLLQGPTSTGKTSMIEYLALRTGHRFMRINNHEHTEITEYIGGYATNHEGQMEWQEGVLVSALRKGWWLVLDELNLAPSEVLEALNRLLDGNRELFIPETQETVKPHPHFRLFATQNPPGAYGGRKTLSRAFRNRFLELHVDEASPQELQLILELRCGMPMTFARKIIDVMKALQQARQGSRLFSGKAGFITPRDLFRWAERKPATWSELAQHGYMLLAERARKPDERAVVKETIESNMKEAGPIDVERLYDCASMPLYSELQARLSAHPMDEDEDEEETFDASGIVWTQAMKRLFTLLCHCIEHKEPVLLVGGTGIGKTTVCQLFSVALQRKLHIVNCHQHTDTADFIGGFRPVREREKIESELIMRLEELLSGLTDGCDSGSIELMSSKLDEVVGMRELDEKQHQDLEKIRELQKLHHQLFTWSDGALVTAMRGGHLFVIDEISLADDAVLERLNSVLEPNRLLVLAERSDSVEELTAHEEFRIMATMNPGGDFGKKELSPALRNRFTEIWVSDELNSADLKMIVDHHYISGDSTAGYTQKMVEFAEWLSGSAAKAVPIDPLRQPLTLSLRDVMTWIGFMNTVNAAVAVDGVRAVLSESDAYLHGAFLVLLDGLGLGRGMAGSAEARVLCLDMLQHQGCDTHDFRALATPEQVAPMVNDDVAFGCHPFVIARGPSASTALHDLRYNLSGGTYGENARRVLRAMQLPRPILLEGPPGVGKSSLIEAIAKASGHTLVRINLSEQTEISDLMGNDLPVSGGDAGDFAWRDGAFLSALKNGDWVLLDELNLASQAVLEGLNSCLDHRGTVWIPEVGRNFDCPSSFRIFGAQNPLQQGGGRKGLPKSFLNRFTKVYIERFLPHDLERIAAAQYPQILPATITNMVRFNTEIAAKTSESRQIGRLGYPWDFNLRDILRWAEMMCTHFPADQSTGPGDEEAAKWVDLLYVQRMRSVADRDATSQVFEQIFGALPASDSRPHFSFTAHEFRVGRSRLSRKKQLLATAGVELLQQQMATMETVIKAIEMRWLAIIVGDSGAGKTSMIRLLAHISGNPLYEYTISNSADTSEFLGCFEQIDPSKAVQEIMKQLEEASSACAELLVMMQSAEATDAARMLLDAAARLNSLSDGRVDVSDQEKQRLISQQSTHCSQLWGQIQQYVQQFELSLDTATLQACMDQLDANTRHTEAGRFEWVDGKFLEAVEHGGWVVLDNVNLCEPTVLDRLNPLFETGGTLSVNEQGLLDGEVRTITPHEDFRLFMVMDPASGEISRAMRNRGVEVFVLPPRTESRDVVVLLSKLGLAGELLPARMCRFHDAIGSWMLTNTRRGGVRKPWSVRDILQWGRLSMMQIQSGVPPAIALRGGMIEVYGHAFKNAADREALVATFDEFFDEADANFWRSSVGPEVFCAGVWPRAISATDYCWDCESATMDRQGAVYEMLVSCCTYLSLPAGTQHGSSASLCAKLALERAQENAPCDLPTESILPSYMQKAEIAGKVFVQHASQNDWSSRRQWLERAHGRIQHGHHIPPVAHIKDVVAAILEGLFDGTFATDIQQLRHLLIWQVTSQHYAESHHTQNSRDLQPVDMSLVQLSFCASPQSQHPQKEAVVQVLREQNQAIEIFYPLFQAARQFVQSLCTEATQMEDRDFVSFGAFLDDRNKLFQLMSSTRQLDPDRFLVAWRAFCKSYAGVTFTGSCADDTRNLKVCIDAVKSAMKLRDKLPRTLWKYGGFPRLPKTRTLSDVDDGLLRLSSQMSCRQYVDDGKHALERWSNAAVRSTDMKRAVSEAIFTLRSLHWLLPSANNVGEADMPSSTLDDISAQLTSEPDKLASEFAELSKQELPDGDMVSQLWQLSDHILSRAEFGLLCTVSHLTHNTCFLSETSQETRLAAGSKASMRSAVLESTRLVEIALHHTARSCVDVVPHKQLICLASDDATAEDVQRMLPSVVADMMYNWHRNLWVASEANQADTERWKIREVANQASDGPAQLSQPLHTLITAGILENLESVSIAHQDAKVQQIRSAASRLYEDAHGAHAIDDPLEGHGWALFLNVLSLTMQCFRHKLDVSTSELVGNVLDCIARCPQPTDHGPQPLDLLPTCTNLRESLTGTEYETMFELSLAPILVQLSSERNSPVDDMAALGEMWVLLGVWRMRFMLPPDPVDPVVTFQIKLDMLKQELADIQCEIDVWREQEKCYRGRETNEDIVRLEKRRSTLQHRERKAQEQILPRPVPCQFATIFQELWDLFDNVVSKRACDILTKISSDSGAALRDQVLSQERMCQQSISRAIARLSEQYPLYRDVTQPCVLSAYEVKYGLRLAALAYGNRHREEPLLFSAASTLLGMFESDSAELLSHTPLDTWALPKSLLSLARSLSIPSGDQGLQLLETCMSTALSTAYLDGASTGGRAICDSIFSHFADVWGASEEKAMKLKEEQNLEFRIHATDAEPPSIFPDFHDEFADPDEQGVLNAKAESEEEEEAFVDATLSAVDAKAICSAHRTIYSLLDRRDYQPASLLKLSIDARKAAFACSLKLMASAARDGTDSQMHALNGIHAVLFGSGAAVLSLSEGRTLGDVSQPEASCNVYTDPRVSEVRLVREPLHLLCGRLKQLLERWEDHPILTRMMTLSENVLQLPVQTPVMKALTGVEILLHKAQEWEMNASREVTLKELLAPLMSLIERWRRLELEQWRGLLDSKMVEMEHHCSRYWFFMYRIIRSFEPGDVETSRTQIHTLFESVAEFMQRAPIGEYQSRLNLLLQFAQQIKVQYADSSADVDDASAVGKKLLLGLLLNVHRYFDQFSSVIRDDLLGLRKPLETKLREFVKISRWDKQNYYSLKASAEKSHAKLNQFARQFDDILSQPAGSSIMAAEQRQDMGDAAKEPRRAETTKAGADALGMANRNADLTRAHITAICDSHASIVSELGISDKQRRQGNLERLHEKLVSHASTSILSENASRARDMGSVFTEGFASHIINRALALRANAPLKNMKRKAFAGLLRRLKSIGCKQAFAEPLLLSACLAQIVPDTIQYEGAKQNQAEGQGGDQVLLNTQWSRANDYFFRCIFRLQKLRRLSTSFSSELTAVEVGRATCYVEHLLSITVDQRRKLYDLHGSVGQLRFVSLQLLNTSTALRSSQMPLAQPSRLLAAMQAQATAFGKMSAYIAEKQATVDAFAAIGSGAAIDDTLVSSWRQCAEAVSKGKCALEASAQVVVQANEADCKLLACATALQTLERTASIAEQVREIAEAMTKCTVGQSHKCLRLKEAAETMVKLSTAAISARADAVEVGPGQGADAETPDANAFCAEFGNTFEGLVEQVLLSTQSLCKISTAWVDETANIDEDDKRGILPKQVHHFDRMFAAAAIPTVMEKLSRCCALLQRFGDAVSVDSAGAQALDTAARLLSCVTPMLEGLREAINRLLLSFVTFHSSLGKLLFVVLNVFSEILEKGFCKPPEGDPEEGEDGDDDRTSAGTGMAEGQGEKDVSDQIEDEEQLLGLQGEEQEEQQDDQERGEGKEMENEFEGDMVDKEQKGDEEQDESDAEDDKADLDREMDETDGPDDQVDEKMWGDVEDDEDGTNQDKDEEKVDSMQKTGEKTGQSEGQDREGKEQDDPPVEQTEMPDDDEQTQGDMEEQEPNFVDDTKTEDMNLDDDMQIDEEEGAGDDEDTAPEQEGPGEQDLQETPEEKQSDEQKQPDEQQKEDAETQNEKQEEAEGDSADDNPADDNPADDGADDTADDGEDDVPPGSEQMQEPAADDIPADEEGGRDEDEQDQSGEHEAGDQEDAEGEQPQPMEEDQKPDGPLDGDTREGEESGAEDEKPEEDDERAKPASQRPEKFEKEEHTVMDNSGEGDGSVTDTQAEKQGQDDEQQDNGEPDTMQARRDGTQLANDRQDTAGGDPQPHNASDPPPKSLADALRDWSERAKRLNAVGDAPQQDEDADTKQESEEQRQNDADAYQFLPNDANGQEDAVTEAPAEAHQDSQAAQNDNDESEVHSMDADENDEASVDDMQDTESEPLQSTAAKVEAAATDQDGAEESRDAEQDDDEEQEEEEEGERKADSDEDVVGPEWYDELAAQKEEETRKETKDLDTHEQTHADAPGDHEDDATNLADYAVALEEEEREKLREEVEDALKNWWSESEGGGSKERLDALFREFDRITEGPALELCETLRLVLAPTKASKMKGGYAAGKRINMRAVIPYIASNYKKDKIWLRRTHPDKRDYQVVVAIDDSLSMREKRSGQLACEALLVLCKALERLQLGRVGVVRFGEKPELIHPFDRPYNAEAGAEMLRKFTFAQPNTDLRQLLQFVDEIFAQSGSTSAGANSSAPLQLVFVISDGQVPEGRESCRTLIRQAAERGQMCAAIMIDTPDSPEQSVTKTKEVAFDANTGQVVITPYLDSCPFNFYTVLQESEVLPDVLGDALRQWYEMTTET